MKKKNTVKKITALFLSAAIAVTCASSALCAGAESVARSFMPGDIDGDGIITASDALIVLMETMSDSVFDSDIDGYLDIDKDGFLTSNDSLLILRASVGFYVEELDNSMNATPDEPKPVDVTPDEPLPGKITPDEPRHAELAPMEYAVNGFAAQLFKQAYSNGDSSLISPLSVYIALAMLDNGSANVTREEMLKTLTGDQDISVDEINEYFRGYMAESQLRGNLDIANSMFVIDRSDVLLNDKFIETAKSDYSSEIFFETPDNAAVEKINGWVADKTHDMIKKVLEDDSISAETLAFIINALYFNAKWQEKYPDEFIETFNNYDGTTKKTDFMNSEYYDESANYIHDDKCTGFIKHYEGDYAFVAILPNEDVGIDRYINEMDDNTLTDIIATAEPSTVHSIMPKFELDFDYNMTKMLAAMGMETAFDRNRADFSELAKSDTGNIFINSVNHKTKIRVDSEGTKAAAVTVIEMEIESVAYYDIPDYTVKLDRPFIYSIYDCKNHVPVFIGTYTHA